MYTSLKLLKESQACVPGFSKLLNFFGAKPEVREQRIPLHVLSILGGKEDADWAIENGSVFDLEQLLAFRRRWLPVIFFNRVYTAWTSMGTYRVARQTPKLAPFYKKALTLFSYEEINEFLLEMSLQSHSTASFKATFQSDVYRLPRDLIQYVSNELDTTLGFSDSVDSELQEYLKKVYLVCHGLPLDTPTQKYTKLKKKQTVQTSDNNWNADPDEDAQDELSDDDVHILTQSDTSVSLSSSRTIVREEPSVVPTDVGSADAPTLKQAPVILPSEWRIFGGSSSNSESTNFALVLCPPGEDLYAFMRTMTYKLPRGTKIESSAAKLTVQVSGAKAMFAVVSALNAR